MSHGVIKKAPQPPSSSHLNYINLSFLQTPLLNMQTVQDPLLFRQLTPSTVVFHAPLPKKKKNRIFQWTPILKFFILNLTQFFKSN